MSAAPRVSRRALDALHPAPTGADWAGAGATPVTRAFVRVEAALDAYMAALDRIEDAVVAAHGYPRVPLPNTGSPSAYAADATIITHRLGPGPAARRLAAELRRRQATFARAARTAGFDRALAREARAAEDLSTATADLLRASSQTHADLAQKLTVLIAAGEAMAEDALAFP